MTFSEFETQASRTINPRLGLPDRLLDAAAGLAEEAGEALGLVRKHRMQGRPLDRERLREELGDALWCLTVAAQSAGIPLEEVAAANLEKLKARHPDGFKA